MHAEDQAFEIVDPHVHLWDLRRNGAWYPGIMGIPKPGEDGGLGDTSRLRRDYLLPQYDADTCRYKVRRMVHVSATQGPGSHLGETRWLEAMMAEQGRPHALIGASDPTLPLSAVEAELDALQRCSDLRGVRVMFGLDAAAPWTRDFLRLLTERGLIFELVAHPHNATGFARLLDAFPNLHVVLEHMGWPTAPDDPGHFAQWRLALRALAGLDTVHCKLSGLSMALHAISEARMRPWLEAAIEDFGVDRCCFASNFPVDSLFGSFDDLYRVYRGVAAELGASATRKLFVENAARTYRL